jgi:hypothetical protein
MPSKHGGTLRALLFSYVDSLLGGHIRIGGLDVETLARRNLEP